MGIVAERQDPMTVPLFSKQVSNLCNYISRLAKGARGQENVCTVMGPGRVALRKVDKRLKVINTN